MAPVQPRPRSMGADLSHACSRNADKAKCKPPRRIVVASHAVNLEYLIKISPLRSVKASPVPYSITANDNHGDRIAMRAGAPGEAKGSLQLDQ
jgi:hypothetical protein